MSIGIYKIVSPSNRIYVGQSIDIENRLKAYKSLNCIKQPKIYRSIKKHGWDNHKYEILEECNINELNNKEVFWKQYYLNNVNNNWNKVLFCDLYDTGSGPKSENTRRKMSISAKGVPKNHGDLIRIAKSKAVDQYSLDGIFIKTYPSAGDAGLHLGQINGSMIGNCCNKIKNKTVYGYLWEWSGNIPNFEWNNSISITKHKKVYQYDLFGGFIREWDSMFQVSKTLNIDHGSICNASKNKNKIVNNSYWTNEYYNKYPYDIKIVVQYDKNNELINKYSHPIIAELIYNGFNTDRIASCCRNERKLAYGYIWKYEYIKQ